MRFLPFFSVFFLLSFGAQAQSHLAIYSGEYQLAGGDSECSLTGATLIYNQNDRLVSFGQKRLKIDNEVRFEQVEGENWMARRSFFRTAGHGRDAVMQKTAECFGEHELEARENCSRWVTNFEILFLSSGNLAVREYENELNPLYCVYQKL